MTLAILLYKEEDEVYINLYLLHQFHLEDNIITDIFFILRSVYYLISQVKINAGIILHISLAEHIHTLELIKDTEQVSHLQNITKQLDKLLLSFFTNRGFAWFYHLLKFLYQFLISFLMLTLIIIISIEIIIKRTEY